MGVKFRHPILRLVKRMFRYYTPRLSDCATIRFLDPRIRFRRTCVGPRRKIEKYGFGKNTKIGIRRNEAIMRIDAARSPANQPCIAFLIAAKYAR